MNLVNFFVEFNNFIFELSVIVANFGVIVVKNDVHVVELMQLPLKIFLNVL